MATGSFEHNIIIKDKKDAKAFIDALEAVVFKRENANKTKKAEEAGECEIKEGEYSARVFEIRHC